MRLKWWMGVVVPAAMLLAGCSALDQSGVATVRTGDVSVQPAITIPEAASATAMDVPILVTLDPPTALSIPVMASPTTIAAAPATQVRLPTVAPAAPPAVALAAAAERANQASPPQPRSATQGGSPAARVATEDSNPQGLLLHPFMPANGRVRTVVLDPGHGGAEVGAGGAGLAEKNVNLSIALELRSLLEQDGMRVILSREDDSRANALLADGSFQATTATRQDLQARLDLANREQADAFISIHNNGSGSAEQSGTEVWYDGKRPFGAFNAALADETLTSLIESIHALGYPTINRGLKEDTNYRVFNGRAYPLFILGPPRSGGNSTRAGQMPAILGETLFLSSPAEAWQLTRSEMITAIAEGYRQGLNRYFQLVDNGTVSMPPEGWQPETPNYFPSMPNQGATG